METKLIKIGNSRGVIIPRHIIDRLEGTSFDMKEEGGAIILKPLKPKEEKVRSGWDEAFAQAIRNAPLDEDFFEGMLNNFDEEEWTW